MGEDEGAQATILTKYPQFCKFQEAKVCILISVIPELSGLRQKDYWESEARQGHIVHFRPAMRTLLDTISNFKKLQSQTCIGLYVRALLHTTSNLSIPFKFFIVRHGRFAQLFGPLQDPSSILMCHPGTSALDSVKTKSSQCRITSSRNTLFLSGYVSSLTENAVVTSTQCAHLSLIDILYPCSQA